MAVMVGLSSTTSCSVGSCPSTHVSHGTLWIQDSRRNPPWPANRSGYVLHHLPGVRPYCQPLRSGHPTTAPPTLQQLHPLPSTAPHWPPRRPETLLHICVEWNKKTCIRPACTYRHVCATFQSTHRAQDCPDMPADSEYRPAFTKSPSGVPAHFPAVRR